MAWVRIHDGAMTHPKLLALTDKAFRLWVWGLSYCQTHLTDGAILTLAIPPRLKRAVEDLVTARLWERIDGALVVHDYLDWNDSRALVTKKRNDAKGRMADARDRRSQEVHDRRSQNVLDRTSLHVLQRIEPTELLRGLCTVDSFPEKGSGEKPTYPPALDEALGERAARFLEKYQELYTHHRHGAHTLIKPAIDHQRAMDVCRTWRSDRLEKMAAIFLTTDDDWISRTDRGFGVFVSRAAWCDDRLTQWEQEHQVKV